MEGGTNGSQDVNMAPMGKTSLGRVIHARKRQKTSFTNLETHGDGSGYLACDTCSSGVPNEIVPAGIVPIGNILVGNNIGFQTRTKGGGKRNTAESQADKGKKNTAESQAAKGSFGGKKNTAESQAAKGSAGGKKNTAESQAAKGSSGGKKNTAESQAAKGSS